MSGYCLKAMISFVSTRYGGVGTESIVIIADLKNGQSFDLTNGWLSDYTSSAPLRGGIVLSGLACRGRLFLHEFRY